MDWCHKIWGPSLENGNSLLPPLLPPLYSILQILACLYGACPTRVESTSSYISLTPKPGWTTTFQNKDSCVFMMVATPMAGYAIMICRNKVALPKPWAKIFLCFYQTKRGCYSNRFFIVASVFVSTSISLLQIVLPNYNRKMLRSVRDWLLKSAIQEIPIFTRHWHIFSFLQS